MGSTSPAPASGTRSPTQGSPSSSRFLSNDTPLTGAHLTGTPRDVTGAGVPTRRPVINHTGPRGPIGPAVARGHGYTLGIGTHDRAPLAADQHPITGLHRPRTEFADLSTGELLTAHPPPVLEVLASAFNRFIQPTHNTPAGEVLAATLQLTQLGLQASDPVGHRDRRMPGTRRGLRLTGSTLIPGDGKATVGVVLNTGPQMPIHARPVTAGSRGAVVSVSDGLAQGDVVSDGVEHGIATNTAPH